MNSYPRTPFILAPRPLKRTSSNMSSKHPDIDKENKLAKSGQSSIFRSKQNISNSPSVNKNPNSPNNPFSLAKSEKKEIKENISKDSAEESPSPFKRGSLLQPLKGEKRLAFQLKDKFAESEDLSFSSFEAGLKHEIMENEAKDEILSILSTDHSDSVHLRKDVRSSMPPLRPHNPIFKNFPEGRAEAASHKFNNDSHCKGERRPSQSLELSK